MHDIGPLPPFERRDAASNPHRGELSDDEILRDHAMALTLNSGRRIHGIRTEMRLDSRNVPSEDAREKSITKLALLGKVRRS